MDSGNESRQEMGVPGALLSRGDGRADCTSVGTSSVWLPDYP